MNTIVKFAALILLVGFVFSCKPSGDKAGASAAAEVAEAEGKTYNVDLASSKLMWEGSKVTGKHNGDISLSEGSLVMKDGKLTGGNFTVDMKSINVTDLEGDEKGYLEAHLMGTAEGKSDDFFNVAKYPTAKFEITKATQLLNNEKANYVVSGNLTLKDVTKNVSFQAQVNKNGDMVNVSTDQFTIDRTQWGIKYGSASFFDNLKDKAISNDMGIKINLTAK